MTELDLYKFIQNNAIEWHRYDNDGTQDIMILLYIYQLEEFYKLTKGFIDEVGCTIVLKKRNVCIWMRDICEYFGIDMDKVFVGEEN